MSFITIAWSIWPLRNEMVFEGKLWEAEKVYDIIKMTIAWRVKSKCPNDNGSIMDIVNAPSFAREFISRKPNNKNVTWETLT